MEYQKKNNLIVDCPECDEEIVLRKPLFHNQTVQCPACKSAFRADELVGSEDLAQGSRGAQRDPGRTASFDPSDSSRRTGYRAYNTRDDDSDDYRERRPKRKPKHKKPRRQGPQRKRWDSDDD